MTFQSRMRILSGLLLIMILLTVMVTPVSVKAEAVAVGQAEATILAALSVTADSNVRFGDVLQGVPVTVSPASNDSSAVFRIAGSGTNAVTVTLMLPTYLSHATNAQDRMDIYFTSTDATYNTAAGAQPATAGATVFNPHAQLSQDLLAGNLAIFLGGTVVPRSDQTPGSYSGDVVVMVMYNGS